MVIKQKMKSVTIGGFSLQYHDYEEYGIKGVCGKPFHVMDHLVGEEVNKKLHLEVVKGLALSKNYDVGRGNGGIPPTEVERHGGNDCLAITLARLDEIDPFGVHRKAIEEIVEEVESKDEHSIHQAVYKYCYFALGSVVPWFFVLYLKKSSFFDKGTDGGVWQDDAKHFPKLVKFVETLPFKHVGRIKIFLTYPGAGVMVHRDGPVMDHRDHNINFFFDGGWRPTFLWDEKKKEKLYLEKGATSYFFNNRDFHGVDPEPVTRYTVRVDGEFTDEECERLGLVNGYTWCNNY